MNNKINNIIDLQCTQVGDIFSFLGDLPVYVIFKHQKQNSTTEPTQ